MDKIRILWTDDRPDKGFPEEYLPDVYREYFEIIDPRPKLIKAIGEKTDYHLGSINDFLAIFSDFWFKNHRQFFPCEVLVTDYDLSGENKGGFGGLSDEEIDRYYENREQPGTSAEPKTNTLTNEINFDGLLINVFYASLTFNHPSSLVRTTALKSIPLASKSLKRLAEPFLGGNFEQNLDENTRNWENIINVALPKLRDRIISLFQGSYISISFLDLEELLESPKHAKLTISSQYITKEFPVSGLFLDIDEANRSNAIIDFAKKALGCIVNIDEYRYANEFAVQLSEFYMNNKLVDERREFSELHSLEKKESSRYQELREKFELIEDKKSAEGFRCSKNCYDIRSGDKKKFTKEIRRLAALIHIRKILKLLLNFKKKTNIEPTLDENDIYLALFPVPASPLVLPWHRSDFDKTTWYNYLKSLGLSPSDLLKGNGIKKSERQILKGLAMGEDVEFGKTGDERLNAWKQSNLPKDFLFGNEKDNK